MKFLTPLGVSSHLIGWGVAADRITELDWWQNHKVEGVEFIATPAQHFSGRDGLHENATLWASWVMRNSNHNIYFSGDSGYDTHFKAIGDKFGPFDLAFHTWYEPIAKLYKSSKEKGFVLVSPMLGQIVTINDDYKNEPWWEKIVSPKN